MPDSELAQTIRVFEATTGKFIEAISDIATLFRDNDPQVIRLKLQQLESDADETRRALYGHNGDKTGLVGNMAVIQKQVQDIDDAQKSLQKMLAGMAVGVIMTLIGVGIQILLTVE